jgi:pimeloyl-ACP methyl ester carboxylesterase
VAQLEEKRTMPAPLTAASACELFLRPPKHRLADSEVAVLESGTRAEIGFGSETLVVWSWGEGPTVLLVHGWGGQASKFSPFIPALAHAGFRAVAMDAPAHGYSTGTHLVVTEFGKAVGAVAESIGGIAAVIAHSVGSAASQYAFSRGLQASASVHIAPASSLRRVLDRFAAGVGLAPEHRPELHRRLEACIDGPLELMEAENLRVGFKHPALIYHDPADAIMPYLEGEHLATAWADARLEPVPEVGHNRIIRNANVVNNTVTFIAQLVSR